MNTHVFWSNLVTIAPLDAVEQLALCNRLWDRELDLRERVRMLPIKYASAEDYTGAWCQLDHDLVELERLMEMVTRWDGGVFAGVN